MNLSDGWVQDDIPCTVERHGKESGSGEESGGWLGGFPLHRGKVMIEGVESEITPGGARNLCHDFGGDDLRSGGEEERVQFSFSTAVTAAVNRHRRLSRLQEITVGGTGHPLRMIPIGGGAGG